MTSSSKYILITLIRSEHFDEFNKFRITANSTMVYVCKKRINTVVHVGEDACSPLSENILDFFHCAIPGINLLENCAVAMGTYLI